MWYVGMYVRLFEESESKHGMYTNMYMSTHVYMYVCGGMYVGLFEESDYYLKGLNCDRGAREQW